MKRTHEVGLTRVAPGRTRGKLHVPNNPRSGLNSTLSFRLTNNPLKKIANLFPFFRSQSNINKNFTVMKTYTQHLFQWVWSTKMHQPTLTVEGQAALFAYIAGVLRKKNCHVYTVNGTTDHIHIISSLHPSQNVASLIKDIKLSTHAFIGNTGILPRFRGWQTGYGSFTYAKSALKNLVDYVDNQQEQHKIRTFRDELIDLLNEHGVDFDERYLL
jgi:putative transposase